MNMDYGIPDFFTSLSQQLGEGNAPLYDCYGYRMDEEAPAIDRRNLRLGCSIAKLPVDVFMQIVEYLPDESLRHLKEAWRGMKDIIHNGQNSSTLCRTELSKQFMSVGRPDFVPVLRSHPLDLYRLVQQYSSGWSCLRPQYEFELNPSNAGLPYWSAKDRGISHTIVSMVRGGCVCSYEENEITHTSKLTIYQLPSRRNSSQTMRQYNHTFNFNFEDLLIDVTQDLLILFSFVPTTNRRKELMIHTYRISQPGIPRRPPFMPHSQMPWITFNKLSKPCIQICGCIVGLKIVVDDNDKIGNQPAERFITDYLFVDQDRLLMVNTDGRNAPILCVAARVLGKYNLLDPERNYRVSMPGSACTPTWCENLVKNLSPNNNSADQTLAFYETPLERLVVLADKYHNAFFTTTLLSILSQKPNWIMVRGGGGYVKNINILGHRVLTVETKPNSSQKYVTVQDFNPYAVDSYIRNGKEYSVEKSCQHFFHGSSVWSSSWSANHSEIFSGKGSILAKSGIIQEEVKDIFFTSDSVALVMPSGKGLSVLKAYHFS
ncbi:hypothetical protein BDQ17DRAFT_1366107 [Cyathus striatus]|nr:hypothetical protein BDQ17DRAFT_1366107 [Cyathus striatus]